MSSDNEVFGKRNGEWKRIFTTPEGVEHVIGVSPEEAERLEAQDNPPKKSVSSGELKSILKEAMSEYNLQDVKDRASAKDARIGGGVVSLNRGNVNPDSIEQNHNSSIHSTLDKLYRDESSGNEAISRRAKVQLDSLFQLLGKELLDYTGKVGITIVECPRCSHGIVTSESNVCSNCGFDLSEGYSRYREINGGRR